MIEKLKNCCDKSLKGILKLFIILPNSFLYKTLLCHKFTFTSISFPARRSFIDSSIADLIIFSSFE